MGRIMWIGGVFSVLALVTHVTMHQQFGVDPNLQALTPENQFVLYTLNACVAFVMVGFAYLSFFHWRELLATPVGRACTVFMALFWFVRSAATPIFGGTQPAFPWVAVVMFALPGLSYVAPLVLLRWRGAGRRLSEAGAQGSPA